MTKKHFIALADAIREHNEYWRVFDTMQMLSIHNLNMLADFCKAQNSNFNRELWLDYIAGRCGPRGGKL